MNMIPRWLGDRFSRGSPASFPAAFRPGTELEQDLKRVNRAFLATLGLSILIAGYAGWQEAALGPVLVWCMASLAAGAATGFLFGIPRGASPGPAAVRTEQAAAQARSAAGSAPPPRPPGTAGAEGTQGLRPNTNLEEVSDWLTKIIVGLGLVPLQDAPAIIHAVSTNAAAAMAAVPTATHVSLATAIVVGFAIEGFFGGYIYTRLFLQGAFARSDEDMMGSKRKAIEQVLQHTPMEAASSGGTPSLPSPSQLQAAAEVQRVVADDPRAAVEKMSELAHEYEQTRATMPSGGERTRRMSEIVARMTVVALGAQSQLSRFASSPQAGDRLAAVVMLKVRFDPAYGPWLADRLVEEPPFVGYHAASALWAACRSLVTAERDKLKALVAAADQKLRSKQLRDDDRDQIIARILE